MVNKLDNEESQFVLLSVNIKNTVLSPLEVKQKLHDFLIMTELIDHESDLDIEVEAHSGWCAVAECGSDNEHDYMK